MRGHAARRCIALLLGVALVAPLPSAARPPVTGSQCVRPAGVLDDDVAAAKGLLRHRYTFKPHPTVRLPADLTWRENPARDPNWQFQLHTLRFTWHLYEGWKATGDPLMLERYLALFRDWVEDNPRDKPPSRYSWAASATSWRAMMLACAAERLTMDAWMLKSLSDHAEVLSNPRSWWRAGNHALNQALGLLAISCVVSNPAWRDMAVDRIESLARRSIYPDGASNEQSPQYQVVAWSRWVEAIARMRACDVTPSARMQRLVALMPRFMAHATTPDGTLEQLGDTSRMYTPRITGTIAEYARTRGASGPRPTATTAVYRRAGFAFGRSGWGTRRPFREETFWSFRFGPGPLLHGHDEAGSLTLHADGAPLLVDPGKYRYRQNSTREWFTSHPAHNVVTVDGAARDPSRPTPLVGRRSTASLEFLAVREHGYRGVRHERRLLYSRRLDYLIVEDVISSSRPRTFRQRWHLPPQAPVRVTGSSFGAGGAGPKVLVRQLTGDARLRKTWGWVSIRYGDRFRAPVVEAVARGERVHLVTLITPSEAGRIRVRPVSFDERPDGFELVVAKGGRRERVVVNGRRASSALFRG